MYSMASVDGRLTIAPGVNLMAGDPRWEAATAGLGDPYDWIRREHDPQVLLEGSGSFVSPPDLDELPDPDPPTDSNDPPPQGEHFLPDDVVTAAGRRWFAVVDGRGRVDLQFTEWPDPAWAGWHALVLTSHAAPDEHLALLRSRGIPYLVIGGHHVDLPAAMRLLGSAGVRTVVCTGVTPRAMLAPLSTRSHHVLPCHRVDTSLFTPLCAHQSLPTYVRRVVDAGSSGALSVRLSRS